MTPATETSRPERPPGGTGAMFDGIASRYDLVNRIISLGLDQSWRVKTVDSLGLAGATGAVKVLDLATGTADLALLIAERIPAASVVGIDPSAKMLEVGKGKVRAAQLDQRVQLQLGSAEDIPYPTGTFDGTTIAFGIRNVGDRVRGLREMGRVTKRGGHIAILELSEPRGGVLAPLARFHVHTVVPFIGSLLSGAKEYRYLQRSIEAFPPAPEFREVMESAELEVLDVFSLFFGVAHLYVARPRRTRDD